MAQTNLQERFHALSPVYYRDADGAVLMYDITDAASLDRARVWHKEIAARLVNNVSVVVAGNKTDLEQHRRVDGGEAEQ